MSTEAKFITLPQVPDSDINYGRVQVIATIEEDGCVDPRRVLRSPEQRKQLSHTLELPEQILLPTYNHGARRFPGASTGLVMAYMGAMPDATPAEALEVIRAWKAYQGQDFITHRDTASHIPACGCGHIDRAALAENEHLYGIPASKVAELRSLLDLNVRQGSVDIKMPVLLDKHKESAVLVVTTDEENLQTVVARNLEHEFFRFDAARFIKELHDFVFYAQRQGIPVDSFLMQQTAAKQRQATLLQLASGLPVFNINLVQGQQSATFNSFVPQQ